MFGLWSTSNHNEEEEEERNVQLMTSDCCTRVDKRDKHVSAGVWTVFTISEDDNMIAVCSTNPQGFRQEKSPQQILLPVRIIKSSIFASISEPQVCINTS